MFETQVNSSGFSVTVFLLQQIAATGGCLVLGALVAHLIDALLGISIVGSDLVAYASFSGVGFLCGNAVQANVPRARDAGGAWVWVIPVLIVCWIAFEARGEDFNLVIANLFVSNPEIPDSGLGILFFTLPAVASCFYSFGVITAKRAQDRRSRPPNLPPL